MNEMKVETFEQAVEHHPEACEAADELIRSLGLVGQRELTSPNDGMARCPYRQWTAIEHEVYSLLCPSVDKVEDYRADTIPLRVLQVLAHAKTLGVYESFEVWHAASPAVKDPVLVGVPLDQPWRRDRRHLLARWGAELDEFPVMMRQAGAIKRKNMLAAANAGMAKMRGWLDRITATENDEDLLGLDVPTVF